MNLLMAKHIGKNGEIDINLLSTQAMEIYKCQITTLMIN